MYTPSLLCLQDLQNAWSPVRYTHTLQSSAYKTNTKRGHQSDTHTLHSSAYKTVVASQVHTYPHCSAYKTHEKRGRQSDTHIRSLLCLQDSQKVRYTHMLIALFTRPTKCGVASQIHTYTHCSAYKTCTKHGHRSDTHTPSITLLTRPT